MRTGRYDGHEIDALIEMCKMCSLGKAVDVNTLLHRLDIPTDVKARIVKAGGHPSGNEEQAEALRSIQAQALIEVTKLDRRRWPR